MSARKGGSHLHTAQGREAVAGVVDPVSRALLALRLTPNAVTLLSLPLNVAAAWVIATGHFLWGGLAFTGALFFDLFDGRVAKLTGLSSERGAFLDAVCDRVVEVIYVLAICYALLQLPTPNVRAVLVGIGAVSASQLISYLRAKAEALGFDGAMGLMGRGERLVLMGHGIMWQAVYAHALEIMLWALLAGALLTAYQRFANVWRNLAGYSSLRMSRAAEEAGVPNPEVPAWIGRTAELARSARDRALHRS